MDRPLPDTLARPARAYLAALVPPHELSDAWHELLEDVTYWGDRDEVGVLRLATGVVRQHQRVTDEAATLALVDAGVVDAEVVAPVLQVDTRRAEALLREVAAHLDDGDAGAASAPAAVADDTPPSAAPADREDQAAAHEEQAAGSEDEATPEPEAAPTAPAEARAATPAEPVAAHAAPASTSDREGPVEVDAPRTAAGPASVRIGFEDDTPLDIREDAGRRRIPTGGLVVAATLVWVVIVVVWVATG